MWIERVLRFFIVSPPTLIIIAFLSVVTRPADRTTKWFSSSKLLHILRLKCCKPCQSLLKLQCRRVFFPLDNDIEVLCDMNFYTLVNFINLISLRKMFKRKFRFHFDDEHVIIKNKKFHQWALRFHFFNWNLRFFRDLINWYYAFKHFSKKSRWLLLQNFWLMLHRN